jgi:hypothetical protein
MVALKLMPTALCFALIPPLDDSSTAKMDNPARAPIVVGFQAPARS